MPRSKIDLILLILLIPALASASKNTEQVLVTASRTPMSLFENTSAITVITSEELERRQAVYVSDALRLTPGLAVSNSGGPSKNTQVRLRGAEGNHVMVLIDGIEVNDPAIGDEFDFATLTTSNVERIEIVRGPQSALWGSDAVAGVINIVTKDPNEGLQGGILLENGSHGTDHQNINIALGENRYGVGIAFDHVESGGTNISRFGDEDDGYEIFSTNLKSFLKLNEDLSMTLNARYEDAEVETDTGFPVVSDADRESHTRKSFLGYTIKSNLLGGIVRNQTGINWSSSNNNNVDESNSSISKTSADKYKIAHQTTIPVETKYLLPINHSFTFVVDHEHQRFRQRGRDQGFGNPNQNQHLNNTGLVGEYRGLLGRSFAFSAAVRRDINSDYNNSTTFKIGSSYTLPFLNIRLKLNYATAQKNPTFVERFGFFAPGTSGTRFEGNPNLDPERATGWQIGLERSLFNNQLLIEAIWFREKLEDEINGFTARQDGVFTALNINGTSTREGLELSMSTELPHGFSLQTNYTYLDATELDSGRGRRVDEVRRPRHTANFLASWVSPNEKIKLNTHVTHSGRFFDLDFSQFPSARTKLKSYTLVGMNLNYKTTKRSKIFLKLDNLFDEDYEEIIGFKTPGLAINAGVSYRFGE